MPFDMIGWAEAAPGTGTVYLTAALLDTLYSFVNDDIFLKGDATKLLGVFYAAESTPNNARLRQPSAQIDHQFIKAVDSNLTPAGHVDPIQGWTHLFNRPIQLFSEKCNALSVNATDEDTLIAILLGTQKITQGMIDGVNVTHIIRGVSDTTVTALSWSPTPITWDQDLPKGRYAIVGMRAGSYVATEMCGVMRLLIPGQTDWRPGVPYSILTGDKVGNLSSGYQPFANWPLDPTISFPYDQMPNAEVLSLAAMTDHVLELQLQKIE